MGQERMINSKGQTVTVAVFTLGNKFKLKPAFTMIKESVICHLSNAPLCKRLECRHGTRKKKNLQLCQLKISWIKLKKQ